MSRPTRSNPEHPTRTNGLVDFSLLAEAPYGAFAVDSSRTVLFWNRSAERILGHETEEVMGLLCCRVLRGVNEDRTPSICAEGCPSRRYARGLQPPPVVHLTARCACGKDKPITITPLVVPQAGGAGPVVVNLFHEWDETTRSGSINGAVWATTADETSSGQRTVSTSETSIQERNPLTAREVAVLRLIALDNGTREIADVLNLSPHTVRNYVRNAREKLRARSQLSVVLIAQRRGLL